MQDSVLSVSTRALIASPMNGLPLPLLAAWSPPLPWNLTYPYFSLNQTASVTQMLRQICIYSPQIKPGGNENCWLRAFVVVCQKFSSMLQSSNKYFDIGCRHIDVPTRVPCELCTE